MGTIQHIAIIVTSYDKKKMTKVRKKAVDLFGRKSITSMAGEGINGYMSFMVAPCGSKAGWGQAYEFAEIGDRFIKYLDKLKYKDGSSSIKHVIVSFGENGDSIEENTLTI